MTGLIIWAGLLIVVLYSPIGSPDLYYSQNDCAVNHTASVTTAGVANAPKSGVVSDDNGLDIPDVATLSKTSYSVRNTQSSGLSSQGSSYSVQTQSYQHTNSSSNSGQNGSGGIFISGGVSRNSASSSAIAMTNGITTLSTTTDLNNQTPKQGANTTINSTGITDPGDDPIGPPIPVGDGCELLIVFGLLYIAFKIRYYILGQLQFHFKKKYLT